MAQRRKQALALGGLAFGGLVLAAQAVPAVAQVAAAPAAAGAQAIPGDYPALPRAPRGAPNILLVMTDDVGFGAASAFGGPVPTPNLERLAAHGLKYTRFHTTAMCSPSRAALLTGRNSHAVGVGSLTDFPMGAPGYTGQMPKSAATIAKVLLQNGYNTAMFGKHHDVPHGPFAGAGPFDYLPNGLGFEYFFGFVGSGTDQWHPALWRNSQRIDEAGPILDQRLADEAIGWIHQQKGAAPDKPFFIYYAPGSAHTPHQAPPEWIARFKGKFDGGWEAARVETLSRQKAMGLVPSTVQLPAWPADLPHWADIPPQEKAFQARTMETFAAELAFQDAQFGRMLDELQRMGQLDNTLVVFVEGDNGPDAAGSPNGALAEGGEISNRRLSPQEHWQTLDLIGGPRANSNYGSGWAQAMATPFPFYKQVASHLGGTRNGLVVSWPGHVPQGGIRGQYGHLTDIYPTLLAAAGIAAPAQVDGVTQQPVDGVDMSYSFADPAAKDRHTVQYYEMLGNRAIYADGWLAATNPQREPWKMFASADAAVNKAPGYSWGLYDLTRDFNQTRDLAAKYPDRLARLKSLFEEQAARFNVNPINDRTDLQRVLSWTRAYGAPRSHYDYWGKGIQLDIDVAPPIAARAFTVTAEVRGGNGVLAATGSSMGGWSFAIRNGHPAVHHALTLMPADQFDLVSPQAVDPAKPAKIAFDFDYDGGGLGKGGTVSIAIDGRTVASGRIEHSILTADPHAESFDIGLDSGVRVSDRDDEPARFTGALDHLAFDLGPIGQKRASAP
jgi:arylsulfatase